MTLITLPRSEFAGFAAVDTGRGRPVLLLHGVGLQADAWTAQIDALKDDHRVIAPDMPGHGQTPCAGGKMTLDDYVAVYLPLLATLDAPALVAGHSMGAMIALGLAARAPDMICGVAALNAVFARSAKAAAAVQARADSLDGINVPDPAPTLERWFGTKPSPVRSACEGWLLGADPFGYQTAYRAFAYAQEPSRDALQALRCPALFATGAQEPNSTPAMSIAMAELAPQGRALIIEGAAHMMPMTHPNAVNGALLDLSKRCLS